MPLNLRKRGQVWYVKGTVKVGDKTKEIKEQSTGLRTKQAADEYLARLTQQIQDELIHGPSGRAKHITFGMIGHMYIERPEGLAKGDIWRVSELAPFMEELSVSDVPQGWQAFKAERCRGLAPATVDRFRTTLVAALNFGCAQLELTAPKIPSIKVNNRRVRWLTEPERETLLAAYTAHVKPIAVTLCFQGCRTHEALDLDWRYVSIDRGSMFFARTKNGEQRTVPMHHRVKEVITDLWIERGKPIRGTVFLNRYGRPYSDVRDYKIPGGNPIKKAHATACKRAGVEDFRPHDWRHHWASWAVMKGVDLETIKKLGGWKSLAMVEKYASVSADHMEEAMRKMA